MPYVASKKNPFPKVLSLAEDKMIKQTQPVVLSEEITEWDQQVYREITSIDLNEKQMERIIRPEETYPQQDEAIACHWHPEFIPIELIRKRIDRMFPNKKEELIIPTDHNILKSYDGVYSGVEVDCFSTCFNRKVQLLLHFENSKMEKADTLKSMLTHTLKYRSGQLFELMDSIVDPQFDHRLQPAAKQTGADEDLVHFIKTYTKKLQTLFYENKANTPVNHIKNKLIVNYFDRLIEFYDGRVIKRAQYLIQVVKKIVKKNFSPQYFYQTEEIIAEARAIGAGIVIPHPEQFWPILLADYDVDGYEVWNPQSREYTEFLINVVNKQNRTRERANKPLLIFMGDDTHMSEKIKDLECQNKEKVSRQIGLQQAWNDLAIRKSLSAASMDRSRLIAEYKSRLG